MKVGKFELMEKTLIISQIIFYLLFSVLLVAAIIITIAAALNIINFFKRLNRLTLEAKEKLERGTIEFWLWPLIAFFLKRKSKRSRWE